MQAEARHYDRLIDKNPNRHLSLQLLYEYDGKSAPEKPDWLDEEFKRLPYKLFKIWLILTFAIAITIEYLWLGLFWPLFKESESSKLGIMIFAAVICCMIPIILVFGCGQMLLGIVKKNVVFAQKGLTKFQISLFGAVVLFAPMIGSRNSIFSFSRVEAVLYILPPVIITINLIGGFAVLRAFKKNHPLARRGYEENGDEISEDFLQQNEILTAEISKYDQKLKKWPYFLYKIWLGLSFSMAIFFICGVSIFIVEGIRTGGGITLDFVMMCVRLCYFILIAVCSYEMIVALRRKILAKSKRALLLLKICICLGVFIAFISGFMIKDIPSILFYLVCFTCVPLIHLRGALCVNKILEQREDFAKVSNFVGNSSYI